MSLYPIMTSLNAIRDKGPCETGWKTLLDGLGKTRSDGKMFPLTDILRINGLTDALWCLRVLPTEYQRDIRLLEVAFARQVQHLMKDPRSIESLDVAERHANGEATDYALHSANVSAFDAAYASAVAAYAVAYASATAVAAYAAAYAVAAYAATAVAAYAATAASLVHTADVEGDWQEALFVAMCNGTAPWQTQGEQS